MEEHKFCHHPRPNFEPFVKKKKMIYVLKEKQPNSQWKKTIGALEFGETDNQRSFKSL